MSTHAENSGEQESTLDTTRPPSCQRRFAPSAGTDLLAPLRLLLTTFTARLLSAPLNTRSIVPCAHLLTELVELLLLDDACVAEPSSIRSDAAYAAERKQGRKEGRKEGRRCVRGGAHTRVGNRAPRKLDSPRRKTDTKSVGPAGAPPSQTLSRATRCWCVHTSRRTCLGRDGLVSGTVVHHVGSSDKLPLLVADALRLVHVEAVDCRLYMHVGSSSGGGEASRERR